MACSLAILLHAALLMVVRGDDIAYVEVSMDGSTSIRRLGFEVPAKAGIAGFFADRPMFSHDWMSPTAWRTTADGVFAAAAVNSSGISKMVARAEHDLSPLFAVLPKLSKSNGINAIGDGAARYALHRYFRRTHGWSLKGLEPAGAFLVGDKFTDRVREHDSRLVTKYALPSLLIARVLDSSPHQGIELRHLSLMVVVIERLAQADLQEHLFLVYRTLHLPIDGERSKGEVTLIVDTFLLTYAFGTNLEISTVRAIEDARRFLTSGHRAWPKIRSLVEELMQASAPPVFDFRGILQFLADFANRKYSEWFLRECSEAKSSLAASPHMEKGRLPLKHIPSPEADVRLLFTEREWDEREWDLQGLGVLEDSEDGAAPTDEVPRLLAANYLLSQALCLSTASPSTICCHNECEDVLERVENTIMAPSAQPEEVIAALVEAVPALRTAGLDADTLRAQASDASDGLVRLHGRPFAGWLHSVLPLECPAPGKRKQISPKTPDEWMTASTMDEDSLVSIIAQHDMSLSGFITMGSQRGRRDELPSDRELQEFPGTAVYPEDGVSDEPGGERRGVTDHFLRFVIMVTAVWATIVSLRSGVSRGLAQASDTMHGKIATDSFA